LQWGERGTALEAIISRTCSIATSGALLLNEQRGSAAAGVRRSSAAAGVRRSSAARDPIAARANIALGRQSARSTAAGGATSDGTVRKVSAGAEGVQQPVVRLDLAEDRQSSSYYRRQRQSA